MNMACRRANLQRSRRNAVRHGLTAETVIGVLEDAEDYKAFEAAIIADYDAQSAVERELVLRLASLLWRLRRATTMETGLLEIQADHPSGIKQACQVDPTSREVVYALFGRTEPGYVGHGSASHDVANKTKAGPSCMPNALGPTNAEFARCFLRLANLSNYALDRLSRYEAILWRQVRQILIALDALDRRKGHQPRPLRRIPDGRGRHSKADVSTKRLTNICCRLSRSQKKKSYPLR